MSDDTLKHYGVSRRSGRYPWGSGGEPYQRSLDFHGHVKELRKKGLSEVEIAKSEGITTTQLRTKMSLEKTEKRLAERTEVIKLKDKGYSNMEIGRRMNRNESSIRSLLDPVLAERASITKATTNMLKESVDQKRLIDIGSGVETGIGVSRTKLNTAVAELVDQGYKIHTVKVPQLGMPGKFTITKVLGAPDSTWREVIRDIGKVQNITGTSDDFGRSYRSVRGLEPIEHISPERIKIRYANEGGKDKDGVIELRRGVDDLDLGKSQYAQVRIGVKGTHYLKGMAIYSDDIPKGVDIVFNTNKNQDVPMLGTKENTVLKLFKDDPDNPFGSTIKRQKGALNVVNEEGDWEKWSRTISSQILSKQPVPLAKAQLDLAYKQKKEEYDEIMQLTNPIIKKKLLIAFGDDCDSSSVHLKAAALPRQASKVILPIPELKPQEVYAPTFNDGERVVLIRHPHGGRFEIPELVVNNTSKAAKTIMKNAPDAIGIHPKVAQKLSGADFDGDAVIVIPNNRGLVKTQSSLKGLEDFDPIEKYRIPKDSNIPKINPKTRQTKMGEVSNLITDMTIKGANNDEIARAVRHSMVVIDSEKQNLNYKQSYLDNGIAALSEKYQNSKRGGASTLISKSSSKIRVDARQTNPTIDPISGKKIYKETGESYTDTGGRVIKRSSPSTRMAEEQDAFNLSSGRPIEQVYATYANNLKSLGNLSRKNAISLKPIPYSPSAKDVYTLEVDRLNANLNLALKNKPIEREAQRLANMVVIRKKQALPDMDEDDLKKLRNQALAEARVRTGAKKTQIVITDKEWEAIQAGAVSPSKLTQIIENADLKRVKQLATPRAKTEMSSVKVQRAKLMLKSGATQAEVADALGISVNTLSNALQKE